MPEIDVCPCKVEKCCMKPGRTDVGYFDNSKAEIKISLMDQMLRGKSEEEFEDVELCETDGLIIQFALFSTPDKLNSTL